MATVPSPRTWTVGELLTASKMNTDVRDGLNFLLSGKPLAFLQKTASQNFSNGTGGAIAWDAETIDRDGGHSTSTNNSRYTAQTAGWYHVMTSLTWVSGLPSTGHVIADIRRTGSVLGFHDYRHPPGSGTPVTQVVATCFMAVADYVEVVVTNNSGASAFVDGGINSRFVIEWISAA